jgi:PAS domain S-box-containing protein
MVKNSLKSQKAPSKTSQEQIDFFIKEATNRLDSKIKQLEESKTGLEEQVEKRTKELQGKLEELEDYKKALLNILEDVENAQKLTVEEKEKIQIIIANLTDGLMVFDPESRLSSMNTQSEKFFEIKAAEILGKKLSDLSQTPFLYSFKNIFNEGIKEIFRIELPLKENLILEISSTLMMKGQEKIGFLVVIHDVTREKNIEKMKSEFVSVSAHQLRTPLSAIKWTLRAILDGDMGSLIPEQIELLNKTYVSNERMIALVNDLLDVSRIEEGRNSYRPTLGSLEPLIDSFVESCRGDAERKQVTVEIKKLNEKIPKVMFDPERIGLVIQNFIENAIRYTPAGGKVTVLLKSDKKEIEVGVRDTGVGIPQSQQSRVFTKFFRGHNVVRMETEGTGLGLFISKNIIEAHNGRIWFESEENKGTTFYFALPVTEEFEEFLKEF